jgi:hypothetical protein
LPLDTASHGGVAPIVANPNGSGWSCSPHRRRGLAGNRCREGPSRAATSRAGALMEAALTTDLDPFALMLAVVLTRTPIARSSNVIFALG